MDTAYLSQGLRHTESVYMNTHFPPKPPFPITMMLIAFFLDIVTIISFGILGIVFGAIMLGIMFVWVRLKTSAIDRMVRKHIKKRVLGFLLKTAFPGVNFVPWNMMLVYTIHNKEKDSVKLIYETANKHVLPNIRKRMGGIRYAT